MSTEIIHAPTELNGENRPAMRLSGALAVRQAMDELKTIRTFVASEMLDGHDYGLVPGTTGKKSLFLPGAQKVAMLFNTCPDYQIQPSELGDGHVEYVVTTRLVSRVSGNVVGSGIGSCSTMEKKYRWRKGGRACPQCGAAAIMSSKYKPGDWYCNQKAGGCGAQFKGNDKRIPTEASAQVENPDIHDVRNTVLKMAKKRSLVDATMGLGCMSELFTQDLEDFDQYDLGEEPSGEQAPPPDNKSGHGRGQYASPEQIEEYRGWLSRYAERINSAWLDRWQDGRGEIPADLRDLVSVFQLDGHLLKWAKKEGHLDPAIVPEDAKVRQLAAYMAIVWHRGAGERKEIKDELQEYVAKEAKSATNAFRKKHPEYETPMFRTPDEEDRPDYEPPESG